MSNLTRLQAVSSSLDTAIGKANSLPNAGSGGGGGSVETCTVTIQKTMRSNTATVKYTDVDSNLGEYTTTITTMSKTLEVQKNTMIVVISADGISASGAYTQTYNVILEATVFYIAGDTVISIGATDPA